MYFSENISFFKYANTVIIFMLIWTQRNILVYLTGVWVLPTGIGALRCETAVCRGWWKLAAGVGSFAQLVSTDPSCAGSRTVDLLGGRRRMLWRPLLVQLNSFTNCKKTTNNRLSFSPFRCSWKSTNSTLSQKNQRFRQFFYLLISHCR